MFRLNKIDDETATLKGNSQAKLIDDKCESKNVCNISNDNQLEISQLHSETVLSDQEEKEELIAQVLELNKTIEDLHNIIYSVKGNIVVLKKECHVLGKYMTDLMDAASVLYPLKKK